MSAPCKADSYPSAGNSHYHPKTRQKLLPILASQGIKPAENYCPFLKINFNELSCEALVDSGSARSLISERLYNRLEAKKLIRSTEKISFNCVTASNAPLPINKLASVHMKLEGFAWRWKFLVSHELGLDCILGADFIKSTGLILDLTSSKVFFKFHRSISIPLVNSGKIEDEVLEVSLEGKKVEPDLLGHLDVVRRKTIEDLCSRFPDVLTKRLGLTHLLEYKINLTSHEVVRSHPYKFAPPKMELLRKTVDELLEQGVIEPSRSSYASPAFLVPKPNGKSRMVIDYRKVNKCVAIDSVPLPDLHSAFDWFGKANFFTIFDLNSAYHQIPLEKSSRPVTSFCVPWNLYQYTRVPMGLAVGAQTLTRLLDMIFHDLKFKIVFNYLDDLLVYSESWDEHVKHLEEVLKRLKGAGLTVNPEKVQFGRTDISFLGHLVSNKGISIDPERTQGIRDFAAPRDAKGISRFLGMVNFYRKFIPNVAELAAPLNSLRKKGARFIWGEEQNKSFETLKSAIMSPPVLRMPDFSLPFVLQTDASSVAIAAVLQQEVDGVRQPIAFASRTLTPQERKASSVYELECLAVVFGVDKFRRFLEHSEFLLETDNQALSWLLAHPRQLGKIGRWVVKIAALKFRVQHIRGTQNVVADALSRMFHEPSEEPEVDSKCNSILLQFPLAFTEVLTYQQQDPELSPVLQELQNGGVHPPFTLSKGVLCCRPRRGERSPRVVLPSVLIPMVFSYFHCSPVGGHLGIHKTIGRIRKSYIWKGMDRDIAQRVRSCRMCSLSKPAQNSKLGLLASEVAERPMDKIFIDFVGKFPRSKTGNTMLLVCVDAFSKFVWLIPLRQATSNTTIQALKTNIFQHFGLPSTIVSDNGSQFTSLAFQRMCVSHGIQHVTTSPYYPQPSHAERFNRNLRSALIAYHAERQDSWDQNLAWLQLAFNSAIHESHKAVPFEVMFGNSPRDPLYNVWKIEDLLPNPSSADIGEVWAAARQNLRRTHEKKRRRYNQGRVPNPFQVGELVFCRTHPLSSAVEKRAAKLCYRWSGPHRISKFLSPVSVSLVDPNSGTFIRRAHISQLKPFRGDPELSLDPESENDREEEA